VELLRLELLRSVLGHGKIVLCDEEVENRVTKEFKSLVIIDSHIKSGLMLLSCVELLLVRLVGHGLDKEAWIFKLVPDDILES